MSAAVVTVVTVVLTVVMCASSLTCVTGTRRRRDEFCGWLVVGWLLVGCWLLVGWLLVVGFCRSSALDVYRAGLRDALALTVLHVGDDLSMCKTDFASHGIKKKSLTTGICMLLLLAIWLLLLHIASCTRVSPLTCFYSPQNNTLRACGISMWMSRCGWCLVPCAALSGLLSWIWLRQLNRAWRRSLRVRRLSLPVWLCNFVLLERFGWAQIVGVFRRASMFSVSRRAHNRSLVD